MSFWVELHCDIQSNGPPDRGRINPFCYSASGNEMSMAMTGNNVKDILAVRLHIVQRAEAGGWVRTRDGWACPNCAKELREMNQELWRRGTHKRRIHADNSLRE